MKIISTEQSDCVYFHHQARQCLRMARARAIFHRAYWQERAADYREAIVDQMRRRQGWTLAERIAAEREG